MWSTPVDLYCERTDAALWAEPFNALTNVAFLIAAALAYRDGRGGRPDVALLLLIAVTVLVGLGSFAFHTLATRGAALLDVIPILLFIHGYLYVALRRFLGWGLGGALVTVAAFYGVTLALSEVVPRDALNGSVGYLPALAAMLGVGSIARSERVRRLLLGAAAAFAVSLTFRTVDLAVCPGLPVGTHALWHLLNAVVLYLLLRAVAVTSR